MPWEILDAEGIIILKSIVKKYAGVVLAGLIRIRHQWWALVKIVFLILGSIRCWEILL
jgi:hypothetical protein